MRVERLPLGLLTFAICGVFAAPASEVRAETSYLKPGDEIAMVGDSVLASGVSMECMQRVIDTLYPDAGIKVLNYGSGGKSADSGITFMEGYKGKRIAAMMYGVNDLRWSWSNIGEKTQAYIRHLTRIVEMAKAKKGQLIFLRETHLSNNAMGGGYPVALSWGLEHLLRAADELAAEHNIPVVDVQAVYRRALAEAWYKDLNYQFSPDVVHPTQPGQAAIAAAMLQAMGVGLPLATAERGPLHLVRQAPVKLEAIDAHGVVAEDGKIRLSVRCRNMSSAPIKGEVTVVAGACKDTKPAEVSPYGMAMLSFEVPADRMPGRWGCLPIYMAFKGEKKFAADHALFYYSRITPTADNAFVVKASDFTGFEGGTKQKCTVSRAAVSYDNERLRIEFQWPDESALAQAEKKGPFHRSVDYNSRGGQPCDAVEFFIDLRPEESTGRFTCGISGIPKGVVRPGVYKVKENGKVVAKLLAPPGIAEGELLLSEKDGNTYVLELKKKSAGASLGFSMRVTNADEFGAGKGLALYLTIKPEIAFEPMSYIRLSAAESGIFYRVGY